MRIRLLACIHAVAGIILLSSNAAAADVDQLPRVIEDPAAVIDALDGGALPDMAAPGENPFVDQAIAVPEPVIDPQPVTPDEAAELIEPDFVEDTPDGYWQDFGYPVPSWVHQWDGSFDFGLTGSVGNSNNTNMGLGLHAKNTRGLATMSVDMDYYFNQDESGVTRNRFYGLGRYERNFDCSAFSWYFDLWYEYDQFTAFRSRVGFHTGLGVSLLEWEGGFLKGRVGLGASRPLSGVGAVWSPEIQAGLDYEQQLTTHQKVFFTLDYYPDINDLTMFRLNLRAGWELLIDEEWDLSLKATAFDRYRTTPDPGTKRNDLDYLLAISWGF